MKRATVFCAALLLSSAMAMAQAGTNNNSTSQHEIKPGTGRGGEILLSPDINQQITGNVGYTEGATPDISSYSAPATAGAISSGAESTAAVTNAEQMTRQYLEDEVSRGAPATSHGPSPANAFNEGAAPQNEQASAQNHQTATPPDKQHPGAETHAHQQFATGKDESQLAVTDPAVRPGGAGAERATGAELQVRPQLREQPQGLRRQNVEARHESRADRRRIPQTRHAGEGPDTAGPRTERRSEFANTAEIIQSDKKSPAPECGAEV